MSNDAQTPQTTTSSRRRRRRRSRSSGTSRRKLKKFMVPVFGGLLLAVISFGIWGRSQAPAPVPAPTLVDVPSYNPEDLAPAVNNRLTVASQQHAEVEKNAKSTFGQRGSAWRIWGEEYLLAKLWPQAAACLQNATAFRPQEWQDRYLLSYAQERSDDLAGALVSMRSAADLMERTPKADVIDRVNAWCFISWIAQQNKQPELAQEALDKALQLDPRCVYALFQRGRLQLQAGNDDEALKDLGFANRLYPDSAPIRALLAELHVKRKNEFAARQFAPRPTTNPKDVREPECPDRLLSRILAEDKPSR